MAVPQAPAPKTAIFIARQRSDAPDLLGFNVTGAAGAMADLHPATVHFDHLEQHVLLSLKGNGRVIVVLLTYLCDGHGDHNHALVGELFAFNPAEAPACIAHFHPAFDADDDFQRITLVHHKKFAG